MYYIEQKTLASTIETIVTALSQVSAIYFMIRNM